MNTLISQLFQARDTAHRLHLSTRSFAKHLALGDLYAALLELADGLAETYQGKYGIMAVPAPAITFNDVDVNAFISELAAWAESSKALFSPEDTHLLNDWDNVISSIFKAKYKLENLA